MDIISYLRQFRIMNFAVFDFAISFGVIYLISPYLSKLFLKINIEVPRINWLFLTLPISVAVHILFWQMTPLTLNFLDLNGHHFTKIIIIGCLAAGLWNIKLKKKIKRNK